MKKYQTYKLSVPLDQYKRFNKHDWPKTCMQLLKTYGRVECKHPDLIRNAMITESRCKETGIPYIQLTTTIQNKI